MPSASSCFLHVFGFRKVTQEKSPEKIRKFTKIILRRKKPRARRAAPGATLGPCATLGRGPGPTRDLGRRGAPVAPLAPTFCPIYSLGVKLPEKRPFFQNSTRGAATTKTLKRGSADLPRHPAGGGDRHRRPLHHHACLR